MCSAVHAAALALPFVFVLFLTVAALRSHPPARGGWRGRQASGHSAILHGRRAGPQNLAGAQRRSAAACCAPDARSSSCAAARSARTVWPRVPCCRWRVRRAAEGPRHGARVQCILTCLRLACGLGDRAGDEPVLHRLRDGAARCWQGVFLPQVSADARLGSRTFQCRLRGGRTGLSCMLHACDMCSQHESSRSRHHRPPPRGGSCPKLPPRCLVRARSPWDPLSAALW